MAQFYTGPDNTSPSQPASTYKNNIDNAFTVHNRAAGGLQVAAQSSPVMTVRYTAGSIQNGVTLTEIATGSTGTITAPSTNPRIDRVVVDNTTGAISVITGAEAASPTAPAITSGKTALAQIALATSTTQITNSLITDERPGISVFASNDLADLDINGGTAETSAADADTLPIYDDSAGANRKMTRANFLASQAVGNIDIAGATDLGAAPASTDEFIVNDAGTNKKVAYSDLMAGGYGELLASATASADATIDMTLTSGYTAYRLEGVNIIPATDDVDPVIRLQTSGGGFRSGVSDYEWVVDGRQGATTASINDSADTGLAINDTGQSGCSSTAGHSLYFYVLISSARDATSFTHITGRSHYIAADTDAASYGYGGYCNTAEDNDAIRFLFSSGNVTSGEFRLYGIA